MKAGMEQQGNRTVVYGHCLQETPVIQAIMKAEDMSAVTSMPGSYTVVRQQSGRTTAYSDMAGQFPLYYARKDDQYLYGTDPAKVARYDGAINLNLPALGAYIIGCTFIAPEETAYQGVNRLLPGHRLALTDNTATVERYMSIIPDTSLSLADAAEQVREALKTAIARRQAGMKSSTYDFSGGLDSTSLAFLAASQMSGDERVHALHEYTPESIHGDAAYAQQFAALDSRIDLDMLPLPRAADPYTPTNLPAEAAPLPNEWTAYLAAADYKLSYLADRGVTSLVTGHAGDALFSPSLNCLPDLARTRPLRHAPRIIGDILLGAEIGRTTPIKLLKTILEDAKTTPEQSIQNIAQILRTGRGQRLTWHEFDPSNIAFLTKEMRTLLAERIGEGSGLFTPEEYKALGIAGAKGIRGIYMSGSVAHHTRLIANRYGIDIHAPYLDNNVIGACLALPAYAHSDLRSFKLLLREALQGIVPAEVYQRTTKGCENAAFYRGLRTNCQYLRDLLGKESMLVKLGIIDLESVQKILTRLELGFEGPLSGLNRMIGTEIWLQQVVGGKRESDSPPQTPQPVVPQPAEFYKQQLGAANKQTYYVPPAIRLIEDRAGIVSFNLATNKRYHAHHASTAVLKALQQHGSFTDAAAAVWALGPAMEREQVISITNNIITGLLEHGTLREGSHLPFTISQSRPTQDQNRAEIGFAFPDGQPSKIGVLEAIRISRSILRSIRLIENRGLDALLTHARSLKSGELQPANPDEVYSLLRKAHQVNRWLPKKAACLELSLAVMLDLLQRGKAVDISIGMSADPRVLHAWPEVNGQAIQTQYDPIGVGEFTRFGTW